MQRIMSRRRIINFVLAAVVLSLIGIATEGCNGEKKCGCHGDLNAMYKPRRHRF